ncbi:MAG: nitroreductase family protein [Mycobacteriales bacterium]
MEFQQVVDRRRMVRNFDPDRPVPARLRERLLANALHAPSAGFSQGWAFLVLTETADRDRFWAVTTDAGGAGSAGSVGSAGSAGSASSAGSAGGEPDSWLLGMSAAPLLIVALSHRDTYLDRYAAPDKGWTDRDEARWPVPYWHIDTGMASLLMLLTAVDAGLGACFFGVPPEHIPPFREAFGVPPAYLPIGAIAVGYRAPDRRSPSLARGRRGVDEVVHRGSW